MRLTPEPRAPNAQGQLEKVCSVNAKLKPSPMAGSVLFLFFFLLSFVVQCFFFTPGSLVPCPQFPLRHHFFTS